MGISRAVNFCVRGCNYVGVDISDECIRSNLVMVKYQNPSARYICDEANTLQSIASEKFPLIVMSGTLHHLHIDTSLNTLSRLLSPNGQLLMFEPMGEKYFINIFRHFTPISDRR